MNLDIEMKKLSNGMRIIAHQDNCRPMVFIGLMYGVGSGDEEKGKTGYAHLCEHLLFTGTKKIPDFDAHMSAKGGNNNAWTDTDNTCFLNTGPANILETVLVMEADRMANMATDLSEKMFQIERDVVRNELREQFESSPYGLLHQKTPQKLFGESHPYGHPIIGSHKDLKNARLTDLKDFIKKYHQPSNAILMMAGDLNVDEALVMAEEHFSEIAHHPLPKRYQKQLRPTVESQHHLMEAEASYHYLGMEWILPGKGDPLLKPMALLIDILGSQRFGQIYQELELKKQWIRDLDCDLTTQRICSNFSISGIPNQPNHIDEIVSNIQFHLKNVSEGKFSEFVLQMAKKRHRLEWLMGYESLETRVELLLTWLQKNQTMDHFLEHQESYQQIQVSEIQSAANWLLEHPPMLVEGKPIS